MGRNLKSNQDKEQLEQGLQRLGIRELEERLEVSPLVFGERSIGGFKPEQGLFNCGTYKEDVPDLMDDIHPPIWID